jgi:hypothetical protein
MGEHRRQKVDEEPCVDMNQIAKEKWCDYGWVCAWVDPEAVDLIEGRIEWEKA